jgi:hypothetical protein
MDLLALKLSPKWIQAISNGGVTDHWQGESFTLRHLLPRRALLDSGGVEDANIC